MAIYGFGVKWGGEYKTKDFIKGGYVQIGWGYEEAEDVYSMLSSVKVGDIIYLKSCSPGSKKFKVKAIGVVTKTVADMYRSNPGKCDGSSVEVLWKKMEQFVIEIPDDSGKLTNIRAATMYEELHPYVQEKIIEKLME